MIFRSSVGGVERRSECCAAMAYHLINRRDQHSDQYDCPDVCGMPQPNGYGIPQIPG